MTYQKGLKYEGLVKDGEPHGKCVMIYADPKTDQPPYIVPGS